jgi:threonine dehydrogenase-like Zn-dependent dehydrogenase
VTNLPKTGRAAVVTEYGAPLEIREYPVVAPEPGGILVKVVAASLCGSDIHLWEGVYGDLCSPPVVPGHEAVGEIVAFGDGPRADSAGTELAVGDRVIWEHEACHHCYNCTVLMRPTLCQHRRIGMLLNADQSPHFGGTIGEYSYVWPNSGRVRVPETVDSFWASAASCALRSVVRGVERLGQVDYRHSVVVQGSGPLGLFATAMLATSSPRLLIVIGAPEGRLEIARLYGADATISVEDHPDPAERLRLVQELTDRNGPDVVCEFSGGSGAFAEGVEMAGPAARYLVVGSLGGPPQPVVASRLVHKELTVIGSNSADIGSFYRALQFLDQTRDRFNWDLMVSGHRYGLHEATLAFERMQGFQETKAVFAPHGVEAVGS